MLLISGFLKAVGRKASAKLTARNRIDGNLPLYFAVKTTTVPCFFAFKLKAKSLPESPYKTKIMF